jgi:hypothetical protein
VSGGVLHVNHTEVFAVWLQQASDLLNVGGRILFFPLYNVDLNGQHFTNQINDQRLRFSFEELDSHLPFENIANHIDVGMFLGIGFQ